MTLLPKSTHPKTTESLLAACQALEGLTFSQLASQLKVTIPVKPEHRKGWVGQALERALGADAGNKAKPDFQSLHIELKTLPIGPSGKPLESTFVTSIPLLSIHQQSWLSSQCYAKLQCILWVPLEGDTAIPYGERRLGRGFLWSPDNKQLSLLQQDWQYLTTQISLGHLETLDARAGEYLQVRPKAADGKSLCYAYDAEGNKIQTLPRGFYLRSRFTGEILQSVWGN